MKISLFASSIKPHLWSKFMESLKSTKLEYEVVMAGFIDKDIVEEIQVQYPQFKYVQTENIKPVQAYEVARRSCTGELIGWVSDDFVFPENALDKIYDYYQEKFGSKFITGVLAIKTHDKECQNNNLNNQRYFSRNLNTPQMAYFGVMRRNHLEMIGGIDRRYLHGKWNDDIVMRVLAGGGRVARFEDVDVEVNRSNKAWHINNDWSGFNQDGEQLDSSWVVGGYKGIPKGLITHDETNGQPMIYFPVWNEEVTFERNDKFEGFVEEGLLTESQGINLYQWS